MNEKPFRSRPALIIVGMMLVSTVMRFSIFPLLADPMIISFGE